MRREVGSLLLETIRRSISKEAVVILVVSDFEGCFITSNLASVEAVTGALSAVAEENAANYARGAYG